MDSEKKLTSPLATSTAEARYKTISEWIEQIEQQAKEVIKTASKIPELREILEQTPPAKQKTVAAIQASLDRILGIDSDSPLNVGRELAYVLQVVVMLLDVARDEIEIGDTEMAWSNVCQAHGLVHWGLGLAAMPMSVLAEVTAQREAASEKALDKRWGQVRPLLVEHMHKLIRQKCPPDKWPSRPVAIANILHEMHQFIAETLSADDPAMAKIREISKEDLRKRLQRWLNNGEAVAVEECFMPPRSTKKKGTA